MIELEEKIRSLPSLPGVYLMKNKDGKPIYIGKATSIKKRVASYFQKSAFSPKHKALMRNVSDIDYIATDSELEALILESTLIKEYRPRYNIRLKDDKRYPMIKITTKEDFPRLMVVRKTIDEAAYFGPYTDSGALRKNLRSIRQIFPISTCKKRISPKETRRPCLNFYIGQCLAPCACKVDEKGYRQMVNDLLLFLRGHHKHLLNGLRERRDRLAEELRFEEAARLRDQIKAIEELSIKQRIIGKEGLDQDVFALSIGEGEICAIVLNIRDGRLIAQNHFFLEALVDDEVPTLLEDFLRQYYLRIDIVPDEIILEEEIPDHEVVREWLRTRNEKVTLMVPKRGERFELLRLAKKNAELLLTQRLTIPSALDELKRLLHLPSVPKRIEAFDVSNIMGRFATASLVVFQDGRPKRDEYRHFRIKTINGADDPGMIREVIGRHFTRILKEGCLFPDLLVIDGGRPQLNAAWDVLSSLGIEGVPIIGLAKGDVERIYTLNRKRPISPKKGSSTLHLLQHIRDEAHRFAQRYHIKLRGKI